MPTHHKHYMPKMLKYPLFCIGLLILVFGELGANFMGLPVDSAVGVGAVGFIVLMISIVVP